MRLSTRNQLKGKVTSVELGSVMATVHVELPDGQKVTSAITKASAEELGVKVGDSVTALIKSTDVMIGVE